MTFFQESHSELQKVLFLKNEEINQKPDQKSHNVENYDEDWHVKPCQKSLIYQVMHLKQHQAC